MKRIFNKKDLTFIANKLTGLRVTFKNYAHFDCQNMIINLNIKQLNSVSIKKKNSKYPNIREFSLAVLLHEIAHYKQRMKFSSAVDFLRAYWVSPNTFEKIADRYALRYYPKVLRAYKKYLTNC